VRRAGGVPRLAAVMEEFFKKLEKKALGRDSQSLSTGATARGISNFGAVLKSRIRFEF
jgi:hypothetical protein